MTGLFRNTLFVGLLVWAGLGCRHREPAPNASAGPVELPAKPPQVVDVGALFIPQELSPGEIATLYLQISVASGWWIGPFDTELPSATAPSRLILPQTNSLVPLGTWNTPEPIPSAPENWVQRGTMTLHRTFRATQLSENGSNSFPLHFIYQPCNDQGCEPMTTNLVEVVVRVLP